MKWYGLWVSGWPGYHGPCRTVSEVEEFESLAHAKRWLRDRYQSHNNDGTSLASGPGSSLSLWAFDPRRDPHTNELQADNEMFDAPYPDRLLIIGPRGGVREEWN